MRKYNRNISPVPWDILRAPKTSLLHILCKAKFVFSIIWLVLKRSGDKSEKFNWQAAWTYNHSLIWPVLFFSIPQPPPVPVLPTDKSLCVPAAKESRLKQQRIKVPIENNVQYNSGFNHLRIIISDHFNARKSWIYYTRKYRTNQISQLHLPHWDLHSSPRRSLDQQAHAHLSASLSGSHCK